MHTSQVVIKDMDESVEFYEALGFEVINTLQLGDLEIIHLGRKGQVLELLRGPGATHHICIQVIDLDKWVENHDMEVVREVEIPELDAKAVFVVGPDGEEVEVIQYGYWK